MYNLNYSSRTCTLQFISGFFVLDSICGSLTLCCPVIPFSWYSCSQCQSWLMWSTGYSRSNGVSLQVLHYKIYGILLPESFATGKASCSVMKILTEAYRETHTARKWSLPTSTWGWKWVFHFKWLQPKATSWMQPQERSSAKMTHLSHPWFLTHRKC